MTNPNNLPNRAEIKKIILLQLGRPLIDIHLVDCQLDEAIDAGIRWFRAKKGPKQSYRFQIVQGQNEYQVSPDVDRILEVVFEQPKLDLGSGFTPFIFPEHSLYYSSLSSPNSMGVYSGIVQALQYEELGRRVLSIELDWRQEGCVLYVFPTPPRALEALVTYKSKTLIIEHLSDRDHDLVTRYAIAMSKRILGNIWSKYDSFPTAQGSRNLGAVNMLSQASEELQALEEEIQLSAYPMGIMVG